jgi:protoheme ferro-lyase
MSSEEQRATQHIGETKPIRNHDHDIVHELSKRLDGVWRYDQYIANAEGAPHVQAFWREIKEQEVKNVERLKELIREHVRKGDF